MALNKRKTVNAFDKGSYTVLSSSHSRLIGCFVNTSSARMFTVDVDCLIRQWDLITGICVRSYPIEKPSAAGDKSNADNNLAMFKARNQIQAVALSPDQRTIAVAFQGGNI